MPLQVSEDGAGAGAGGGWAMTGGGGWAVTVVVKNRRMMKKVDGLDLFYSSSLKWVHKHDTSCSLSFVMKFIVVLTIMQKSRMLKLLLVFRSNRRLILNLMMIRKFVILFIS